MILIVGMNLALDLVIRVSDATLGSIHHSCEGQDFPAGKAMNCARVLAALGNRVQLTGLVGNNEATRFEEILRQSEIENHLVSSDFPTRINVKIIDRSTSSETQFNVSGAEPNPEAFSAVHRAVETLLPGARILILTGSLPPGCPEDLYASWIRLARSHGVECFLDARGAVLARSIKAAPACIKINRAELAEMTGVDLRAEDAMATAMRRLNDSGIGTVVVTDGPASWLMNRNAALQAHGPMLDAANPIGAGDAFLAGYTASHLGGDDAPTALRSAVATAAAKAANLDPGAFDPSLRREILSRIRIDSWHPH